MDLLRLKRFKVVKFPSVGIYRKKTDSYIPQPQRGVSDILACSPSGQFWAIEVKNKYGVPSKEQVEFLDSVKNRGGVAILAYDIDEVLKHLN